MTQPTENTKASEPELGPWTCFHDMSSGGGRKEEWRHIFIQAPKDDAKRIFQGRFGHNPERVSCTCCGDDYSISESESLRQATGYERRCAYFYVDPDGNEHDSRGLNWYELSKQGWTGRYVEHTGAYGKPVTPLDEYMASGAALFITADEIQPEWRNAELKESGYVWVD